MKNWITMWLMGICFSSPAWAGCMPCYDYCPGEKPPGCCGGRESYLACSEQKLYELLLKCEAVHRELPKLAPAQDLESLLPAR